MEHDSSLERHDIMRACDVNVRWELCSVGEASAQRRRVARRARGEDPE